jgi:SAM-dependent methyltransferase
MRRSSEDGPEGSGGEAEDLPPKAEPREPAEDAAGETTKNETAKAETAKAEEPAAGAPPVREVKTSRTVVVGESHESEPPVELTEEHEESAAPMIDDESPVEDWPDEISLPGASHPPTPESIWRTHAIVPAQAPNRPRSEPPPDAAFHAAPESAPVIPVPPPFVPFPDSLPFDAAKTTKRPAVAPPPPPPDELSLPVAPPFPVPSAPPAPVSAARVPSVQPPRPSSRPSPQPSMPPPVGLPKVMISEEAYRPSQVPPVATPSKPSSLPPPSAPGAPRTPSLRDTPAFGVMPQPGMRASPPFGTAAVPQPETRTSPPFGTYVNPASAPPHPHAAVDGLLQPSSTSEPPMEVPADAALEETDEEETAAPIVEDAPEEDEAAARERPKALVIDDEAAVDEAEEVSVEEAEEEPSESGTAAPTMDDAGLFPPEEAEEKPSSVEDVFAPPTAAARRFATESEEEGHERPRQASLVDALPSVISIPEDDIPRVASALHAPPLPVQPETPAEPEPASAAKTSAEGKAAERIEEEELAETDVQSIEGDEGPAGQAAPVAARPRPRPVAIPARPSRPRRRRKHGERRPWWEEIFDEEYIRSLPKYTPDQTRHEVDYLERVLGVAKTARILDVGCGEGRHAVELAARGYEVVGLDLSIAMLARAGEAAQAKGVKINFIQGDMRDMRFDAAFDAIYCVGTTFGYFDDDANAGVLAGIFRALKPGGRLLLGMCNRDHVLLNQPRSTWFQGDDRQYLEDTDFNYITSRLVVKRSWATSAGDQESVEYSVRLYALHEMGRILHTAGFKVTEVSGHFATPGVFFGADSSTLLLLAEKP